MKINNPISVIENTLIRRALVVAVGCLYPLIIVGSLLVLLADLISILLDAIVTLWEELLLELKSLNKSILMAWEGQTNDKETR